MEDPLPMAGAAHTQKGGPQGSHGGPMEGEVLLGGRLHEGEEEEEEGRYSHCLETAVAAPPPLAVGEVEGEEGAGPGHSGQVGDEVPGMS